MNVFVTSTHANWNFRTIISYMKREFMMYHDIYVCHTFDLLQNDLWCYDMNWKISEYEKLLRPNTLEKKLFDLDIEDMKVCDACIIVFPCGGSSFVEAAWFACQGKPVYAFHACDSSREKYPNLQFSKVYNNLTDIETQLYRDACLLEMEDPAWDYREVDEADRLRCVKEFKEELNKVLTDDMIDYFMLYSKYSPEQTATFIAGQYIIELPDIRLKKKPRNN